MLFLADITEQRHPQNKEQENRQREILEWSHIKSAIESQGHKHKIRGLHRTEKVKKICKSKCSTCQTSQAVEGEYSSSCRAFLVVINLLFIKISSKHRHI